MKPYFPIGGLTVTCFALITLAASQFAQADTPALMELKVGNTAYQGKLVARNKQFYWLLDRAGRLNEVKLESVKSLRRISSRFRPYTPGDMRTQLLRDFGKQFRVVGTGHYLVCAAAGKADTYAKIFEDIYRTFHMYFSIRGFDIDEPEFPLVALIFPDRKNFVAYCKKDGVTASKGLRGYYMPTTNRVALYDPGNEPLTHNATRTNTVFGRSQIRKKCGCGTLFPHSQWTATAGGHSLQMNPTLIQTLPDRREGFSAAIASTQVAAFGKIDGDLRDTIVHEATHQVAFNTGLHVRFGENPKWVVEGLATVFESPGIRKRSLRGSAKARVNHERFGWFQNFSKKRRKQKSLEEFITNDDMFKQATLDAYSQAWALTFFLVDTRPRKFGRLLKKIAARDPMKVYSGKERITDFKNVFGDRLVMLEAEFLRFMKRLK